MYRRGDLVHVANPLSVPRVPRALRKLQVKRCKNKGR